MNRETEILDFLKQNFHHMKHDLNKETLLLADGIVDSMGMIEIINFLEKKYGIIFNDNEIIHENFKNVSSILQFIERKMKQV